MFGLLMMLLQGKNKPEDENSSSGSSINLRELVYIDNDQNVVNYKYSFNNVKKRSINEFLLKDLDYSFLEKIDFLGENEFPQGLCITDEYVIISSYMESRKELGEIKIFDKKTGAHLISLGVDAKSHLGGITFDGHYIWICNSNKMALERISYEFIQESIKENKGKTIDIRKQVDRFHVNNIPSCVTYHNGYLFVTSHSTSEAGEMIGYVYDFATNRLEERLLLRVPPKVQGVTFTDKGEVVLSISYGRRNSSYVKIYQSLQVMNNNIENYQECIELPPCSEGIFYTDNKIYVLFESAATKYFEGTDGRGKSKSPLNKILVINKIK